MRHLLTPGTILCHPTTTFPAPKRGEPLSAASVQRDRILCLCAHGGLTGVPQVSIPGAQVDGFPRLHGHSAVAVSFVDWQGVKALAR
jgi:amidase